MQRMVLQLAGVLWCTAASADAPAPWRAEALADPGSAPPVEGVVESAHRIQHDGRSWTLVLSGTGAYASSGVDDARSARLYATLFETQDDGSAAPRWRIQDWVEDCPVDVITAFTDPAFQIGDADADGVLEIWVAYRLACRGDVSPSTLKVIGYEGQTKYALRGRSRIQYGDTSEGGEFTADPAFGAAPQLRIAAEAYWNRVRDERF